MSPNVILIVFDTARADAIEPYGAPAGSSPTMAGLAASGVVAPRTRSTSNWTMPAHASLFTGYLPQTLGFGEVLDTPALVRGGDDASLPAELQRSGWATAGASANPWITPRHGFDHGFNRFDVVTQRRHVPRGSVRDRLGWLVEGWRARTDDGLAALDGVVDDLFRSPTTPFFWFFNLMECHSPYLPPLPYNDLGAFERVQAVRDAARYQTHRGFLEVTTGQRTVPPRSIERMRHLYARSVRAMDDWVGRLVDRLERHGLLEETLVVVTSDHGENLGECGRLGHGITLDERLLHVPLVASGPESDRFGSIVSLRQVPGAIANACNRLDHPWSDHADTDVSISHVRVEGDFPDVWDLPPELIDPLRSPRTAAARGRLKLVRTGDDVALFDVDADPDETTDLSASRPHDVKALLAAIEAADALPPRRPAPTGTTVADGETDDLERRLRLLGYL